MYHSVGWLRIDQDDQEDAAVVELGLIRPDMRAAIGRPYREQVSYPVSASDIRRWVQAVHYPEPAPPGYLDPEVAASGELVAPLDFNPFAWGFARAVPNALEITLGADVHRPGAMEHLVGVTPPALTHAINGGVGATYTDVRMRPGDVISARTAVAGYSERTGRLGPMLLSDAVTTWTNQHGQLVKTYRMTLIRY
jgi:hypothetical protein